MGRMGSQQYFPMTLMTAFFSSLACRLAHYWSYANTVETAVLLVIVYDVVWHRWNAVRDIERDKEAEARTIQREEASEKRQIGRERQEFIRRHWQELQSNLILLHRVASQLAQHKQFIEKNNDSQDPTTRHALAVIAGRFPEAMSELDDRWGRFVAQLNVFPEPRDLLALEVLETVEKLGQTVKDKQIEIKDETLHALASLVKRVAEAARLPSLDD